MFKGIKKIHFVGIGGIGMSGIAELLINLGFHVSGSDLAGSETVERLRGMGARIAIGHAAKNLEDAQVVVYSSAVALGNPECQAAKEKGLPVIPRAEMLSELMRMKYSIAVAGTHGKTTTTSMLATILSKAKLDPTAVIGGKLDIFDSNAKLGEGEILVAEADESDRSFLKLAPIIALVTNIEEEHMDCYRDIDDIRETYVAFLNKVPFYGFNMVCLDDKNVQNILPRLERRVITYGSSSQAFYRYTEAVFKGFGSTFTVHRNGNTLGEIQLNVPGMHNCLNALAAMATALEIGVPFPVIQEALAGFRSPQRRCHIRGEQGGVLVMDDYGHHPTEIKMTLKGLRTGFPDRRIVAVFQPHRYTRTRDLFNEFVTAFYDASVLYVTEIYAASESPLPGVSGRALYEEIKEHGYRDVHYCENKQDLPLTLRETAQPGDMILFLGAGDAWRQGPILLEMLKS